MCYLTVGIDESGCDHLRKTMSLRENREDAANGPLDSKGTVITVATIKGGSGKSTLVAGLASVWSALGKRVALIDADPNGTLSRWCSRPNNLAELEISAGVDEYSMIPEINRLAVNHDYVLVDCAGFASQSMVFALGASKAVLIPVMADEANVYEAIRTQRLAENAAAMSGKHPLIFGVLNRIKRALVTEHSREQLHNLGLPLLAAAIGDRAIFQEASFHGSSPVHLMPSSVAASELRAVANEIEDILKRSGLPVENTALENHESN